MAISTTSTTKAPKLQYQSIEDYQKSLATKASPSAQATSYFQSLASGKPSAATSATISANREALARAAASARSTAAQSVVQGGGLGQGQAVRGTQEAEQGILQALADSREKELQVLGTEQASANQTLLDQANTEDANQRAWIDTVQKYGTASQKAASQRSMGTLLNSMGIQMPDEASAQTFDDYFATEAENDPSYQNGKIEAEQTLKNTKAKKILQSGSGSLGSRIAQARALSESDAGVYDAFSGSIKNPGQNDLNVWITQIVPLITAGRVDEAAQAIDNYVASRNKTSQPSLWQKTKTAADDAYTPTHAVTNFVKSLW